MAKICISKTLLFMTKSLLNQLIHTMKAHSLMLKKLVETTTKLLAQLVPKPQLYLVISNLKCTLSTKAIDTKMG